MEIAHEVVVAGDRKSVWRAFIDAESLRKWQPTLESVEHVSGRRGAVGAVSRLTYREHGRRVVLTRTVRAMTPPSAIEETHDSDHGGIALRIAFEPAGRGATRVRVEATLELRGAWRLAGALVGAAFARRTKEDLDRFRDLVEAGEI